MLRLQAIECGKPSEMEFRPTLRIYNPIANHITC